MPKRDSTQEPRGYFMDGTSSDLAHKAQFTIESTFQQVSDLAQEVESFCSARVPGTDTVDDLRLCVAEALNNIVEHAYEGDTGKPIYANVAVLDDRCEVILIDEGKPLPGYKIPETVVDFDPLALDDLPEGGFGWMLIREQMDDVAYERREGCNVLTLAKRFEA